MSFETMFSKSWQEFKANIWTNLKISWWYFVLPMLIISLIFSLLLALFLPSDLVETLNSLNGTTIGDYNYTYNYSEANNIDFQSITGNAISEAASTAGIIILLVLISIIILIFFIIIFYLGYLNILYAAMFNEKGTLSLSAIKSQSKNYFWKFLGLMFIMMLSFFVLVGIPLLLGLLFLFLLKDTIVLGIIIFVLLILVGVILAYWIMIKWSFSIFALMIENKGIIDSIKRSSEIVNGRWWKVFGYTLLIMIIVSAIFSVPYTLISILSMLFQFALIFALMAGGIVFSITIFIFLALASIIFGILWALEMSAIILLSKNLYLEMSKTKK
jgi:hypothetical protein